MSEYLIIFYSIVVYMTFWYGVALVYKRNDVADIGWGLGFVMVAWLSYLISSSVNLQSILVNSIITLWGIRLAWHIYKRNSKIEEDYRYAAWRKEWKNFYLRSYLQVFLLQGLFMFLISLPIVYLNLNNPLPTTLFYIGSLIWLIGFFFEGVGDYQLAQFVKIKKKGEIMQTGLWKYTRHPNYFGEVLLWWGIFLTAFSISFTPWTVIGPLTISILILFVSGIPMLEKKYEGNPEFEKYKLKTSAFFPLPPKNIENVK